MPNALAEMEGIEATDFDRPRGSILYNWARLNCLLYALKGSYDTYLDGELLQHYEHDLNNIYERRQELVSQVARIQAASARKPALHR